MTINISEINSTQIGKQIDFNGIIEKAQQPEIKLKKAVFECRSCMRIHEMTQNILEKEYHQPAVCQECGGKKFKLVKEKSTFIDIQFIELGTLESLKTIKVCFVNPVGIVDLDDKGKHAHIYGKVAVMKNKNNFELVVLCSDEQGELDNTSSR